MRIGCGLTGVIYILDEPSIGLHQRDNDKLLDTLKHLRDLGNTVIVVEHDEDTMKIADYIVDIGKYAGVHGGNVVVAGTLQDVINCKDSITGEFLSGKRKINVPKARREISRGYIEIKGCSHNNLKNVNLKIPMGVTTVVTGVNSLKDILILTFDNKGKIYVQPKKGKFETVDTKYTGGNW